MYPFDSHYHTIDGIRLHYFDEGEGAPVVMVHGNPTWSFYFRRLAAALRGERRVVAPDHVGCGFSDKPQAFDYTLDAHIRNLESLIESLDLEGVTLVLHDWGGAIGMGYAVRHPEKITRIVVLNTGAFYSPRIPFRINICRIPLFGAVVVRGLNGFARAALTMAVYHRERITPEVASGYLLPYDSWQNRVALLRFVQDIPRRPEDASYSVLQEIDRGLAQFRETPMLIQWGARDWCFDAAFLEGWRRRFPAAEADVYGDAAHYVLEDAHERIIPRVKEFLNR
jgi:cis-3-alkyl-4-acyloxetan-2-one decarboxylase